MMNDENIPRLIHKDRHTPFWYFAGAVPAIGIERFEIKKGKRQLVGYYLEFDSFEECCEIADHFYNWMG